MIGLEKVHCQLHCQRKDPPLHHPPQTNRHRHPKRTAIATASSAATSLNPTGASTATHIQLYLPDPLLQAKRRTYGRAGYKQVYK